MHIWQRGSFRVDYPKMGFFSRMQHSPHWTHSLTLGWGGCTFAAPVQGWKRISKPSRVHSPAHLAIVPTVKNFSRDIFSLHSAKNFMTFVTSYLYAFSSLSFLCVFSLHRVGENGEWDQVEPIYTNSNEAFYQVTGLVPFTVYSFRVIAVNELGHSPPSKESYYFVTLREGESK